PPPQDAPALGPAIGGGADPLVSPPKIRGGRRRRVFVARTGPFCPSPSPAHDLDRTLPSPGQPLRPPAPAAPAAKRSAPAHRPSAGQAAAGGGPGDPHAGHRHLVRRQHAANRIRYRNRLVVSARPGG